MKSFADVLGCDESKAELQVWCGGVMRDVLKHIRHTQRHTDSEQHHSISLNNNACITYYNKKTIHTKHNRRWLSF